MEKLKSDAIVFEPFCEDVTYKRGAKVASVMLNVIGIVFSGSTAQN